MAVEALGVAMGTFVPQMKPTDAASFGRLQFQLF